MSQPASQTTRDKNENGWSRYVLVIVGALAAIGYMYLAISSNTGTPFVIARGESMKPTYANGDLLLVERVAPAVIAVGDVVVFEPSEIPQGSSLPSLIAHRVTEITAKDGEYVYRTQGDNSAQDPFLVSASEVRGKVSKNLGPIGRLGLFRINWFALIFFIVPLALVVSLGWTALNWQKKQVSGPTTAGSQ